jgi:hypothetical protein
VWVVCQHRSFVVNRNIIYRDRSCAWGGISKPVAHQKHQQQTWVVEAHLRLRWHVQLCCCCSYLATWTAVICSTTC